jgi:hypothetical protein
MRDVASKDIKADVYGAKARLAKIRQVSWGGSDAATGRVKHHVRATLNFVTKRAKRSLHSTYGKTE